MRATCGNASRRVVRRMKYDEFEDCEEELNCGHGSPELGRERVSTTRSHPTTPHLLVRLELVEQTVRLVQL
jgi:hypothetical protein